MLFRNGYAVKDDPGFLYMRRGEMMSRYQPSYFIEFTPHAEWLKLSTGKVSGYRWWGIGPLSFHVMWSAAPEPLGADNPDMMKKGTPLK